MSTMDEINYVQFTNNVTFQTNFSPPVQFYPRGPPPPMPRDVLESFKKYALIITSVAGMIGNILVFYVFTKTKLKRPSTARYLAATAIADTGYLLTILSINISRYIRIHETPGLCQIISFGQYSFPFLIRWYLTSVVVEKFIGVIWPRKKSQMCTAFRAKCVIISLAITSIVCYLYVTYFFMAFEDPPMCSLIFELVEAWQILTRIDAVVNFAIPYIVMFVLTVFIALKSWQYRKRSMTAGERFLRRRRVTTAEDKEFKTTPLLILLVTCTLLLCVPNSVSRLKELSPDFRPSITETSILVAGLFHYFEVLNSAIKIFIYLVSSSTFARQLANLFCLIFHSRERNDTSELRNRVTTSARDSDIIATEGVV